jgi:dipeptidyl aminopeptidase/acylaminoacyl peptidase
MNIECVRQVSWIGDNYLERKIRGVVLVFHGLGYTGDKQGPDTFEFEVARAGGLVVFPYYGPWSWMNRHAREFTDELVDSVYECFSLSGDIPLISTGGSMGGLASLLYARYAKRPASACLALFPVCDLKYHFHERPDLPKTILHAFRGFDEDEEALFDENSPLSQVASMPDIPYFIVHGSKDAAVSKQMHSDRLVEKMRDRNMNVKYMEVPYMQHGWPISIGVLERTAGFVRSALK